MKSKFIVVIICICVILLLSIYLKPVDDKNQVTDHFQGIQLEVNQPVQVTNDSANQDQARLYGDRLVWQDDRNGNWDIYMLDLSTGLEKRITTDRFDQVDPGIFDDIIVWKDTRNHQGKPIDFPDNYNSDIYFYNISTGKEQLLTDNNRCQISPDIYGKNIIWLDYRENKFEVIMYDLSTNQEFQISNNTGNCSDCRIYQDTVIWAIEIDNSSRLIRYDIYSGQTNQLDLNPHGKISDLRFDQKHLAWSQPPTSGINSDIFLYNFKEGETKQITTNESYQFWPLISGDLIFWTDLRNDPDGWHCPCQDVGENKTLDNWDIYTYNLTTGLERQITSSEGAEVLNDIQGGKIVYIKTKQNRKDIYIMKLGL